MIAPSDTVNISLPPHARHFPLKGGLLYFSVHLLHLNSCMENFLRFPFISLSRCFSITSLATSAASTALILSASSIWPFSLSSIEGIVLYDEHFIPALMLLTGWVNKIPLLIPSSILFPNLSILTFEGCS